MNFIRGQYSFQLATSSFSFTNPNNVCYEFNLLAADSKPDFTISLSGLVLLRASEEKQHLPLLQQLLKLSLWYGIL